MNDPGPVEVFTAKVQSAQADLQHGIDRAGLRDDPLRHPLQALSGVVGLFPDFMRQLTGVLNQARQPMDPAALERMERAARDGAASLTRTHLMRTLAIYGGALLACTLVAGIGGYQWGRASAETAIQHTDQRLAAAFRDGPAGAAIWADLMELNDLPGALSLCVGPRSYVDQAGRKICLIPLYVDSLRRAAPVPPQR